MKNNFSRSNVNEKTLNVTMPEMSSFDLSHRCTVTPQLGKIVPVNIEPLLHRDVVSGNLSANLALEKILTPSIGRVRLDTHTFFVSEHRINRDAKQFYEGMSGYTSKPNFDINSLASWLLACMSGIAIFENIPTPIDDVPTIGDIDTAEEVPFPYTSWEQVIQISVIDQIQFHIRELSEGSDTVGYNLDFLKSEVVRINQIYTAVGAGTITYARMILELLEPYIGEGSLLEMLGYINFTQYSRAYDALANWTGTGTALADKIIAIGYNVYNLADYESGVDPTWLPARKVDESPLRVYYAIWYDYFRNFHVEKRANVLDPDLFGKDSVISGCMGNVNLEEGFRIALNLLVYRTRNFSRDYLTTIQTEDAFRYVYNPIYSDDFNGSVITQDDSPNQFYNTIEKLSLDYLGSNIDVNFPSGFGAVDDYPAIPTNLSVLRSDLQTMRRAGMLEKLLAREYFYPDTYAGKMLAHYGVQPGDLDMLNSVYLAGSEQFINGEQQIANVGTEMTPQGTRTMVGGVNTSDAFAYSATNPGWIMSVISLVPMVSNDAPNMHLCEIGQADIPLPQFASDTRVCVAAKDVLRGFDNQNIPIGYVPRYYAWRVHPDETHGKYLTDYRAYNWLRDWYNMNFGTKGDPERVTPNRYFTLSPYSLRVALPLDAFLGLNNWDSIAFGEVELNFFVTRALPAAVETV